jgi:soluble lytic murein transglycosylase
MKIKIYIIILSYLLYTGVAWGKEIRWDDLVQAVIQVESNGNPNAVSDNGNTIGLMQIHLCGAYREYNMENGPYDGYNYYTPRDLYNPFINIKIGTWYLHRLHDHYGCDTIEKILMAYNGGITHAKKVNFNLNKMPQETRNYVSKVIKLYNKEAK